MRGAEWVPKGNPASPANWKGEVGTPHRPSVVQVHAHALTQTPPSGPGNWASSRPRRVPGRGFRHETTSRLAVCLTSFWGGETMFTLDRRIAESTDVRLTTDIPSWLRIYPSVCFLGVRSSNQDVEQSPLPLPAGGFFTRVTVAKPAHHRKPAATPSITSAQSLPPHLRLRRGPTNPHAKAGRVPDEVTDSDFRALLPDNAGLDTDRGRVWRWHWELDAGPKRAKSTSPKQSGAVCAHQKHVAFGVCP